MIFRIPAPSSASPEAVSLSIGECTYDHHNECVVWTIAAINAGDSSGTLELNAGCDETSLFPLQVEAARDTLVCGIEITEAYHMQSKDAVKYALSSSCQYAFVVER